MGSPGKLCPLLVNQSQKNTSTEKPVKQPRASSYYLYHPEKVKKGREVGKEDRRKERKKRKGGSEKKGGEGGGRKKNRRERDQACKPFQALASEKLLSFNSSCSFNSCVTLRNLLQPLPALGAVERIKSNRVCPSV